MYKKIKKNIQMRQIADNSIIVAELVDQPLNCEIINKPINELLIDELVNQSLNEPTNEPTNEPLNELMYEPLSEPLYELVNQPVIEPTNELLIDEPMNELVIEPPNEPLNEPISEPLIEPVIEPVIEPLNEPLNELVIEPPNEPLNEPISEPLNELIENNSCIIFEENKQVTDILDSVLNIEYIKKSEFVPKYKFGICSDTSDFELFYSNGIIPIYNILMGPVDNSYNFKNILIYNAEFVDSIYGIYHEIIKKILESK